MLNTKGGLKVKKVENACLRNFIYLFLTNVVITSRFMYSLVELCIYGGVDYKPSDGSVSEDGEDWAPSRSASLSSDISAFSSVTLLSSNELDRLLDDVKNLGDDTLQVKKKDMRLCYEVSCITAYSIYLFKCKYLK